VRAVKLRLLSILAQKFVAVSELLDLMLIVCDKLLSFLLKVSELLVKYSSILLSFRGDVDQSLLHLLELLSLCLVLCLSSLLLLEKSLRSIFDLSLHLIFINFDSIFIPCDSAIVCFLQFCSFRFSKLDLLLQESLFLFVIDVLGVELVLLAIKLLLQVVVLLSKSISLTFVLLLEVSDLLFLLSNRVLLRLNLIFKSDFDSLKVSNLARKALILIDKLLSLSVVDFVLLVKFELTGLSLLFKSFVLFKQLLVHGFTLLREE